MFGRNSTYHIVMLVLLLAFIGTGCSKMISQEGETKPLAGEEIEGVIGAEEEPGDAPADEPAALPIGLYIKTGSDKRVLQTQVQAEYRVGKDLVVLSAFLSEEASISGGTFGKVWNSYKDKLPEAALYKIAYRLSYTLASGDKVEQIIEGPTDTETNRNYIETYIYDDVHQDGWYSHLLDSHVRQETIVTSIKLTGGPDVDQVGDIEVEAFLYKVGAISEKAGTHRVAVVRK